MCIISFFFLPAIIWILFFFFAVSWMLKKDSSYKKEKNDVSSVSDVKVTLNLIT